MLSCWVWDPGGVAFRVRPEDERLPQPTEENLRERRKAGGRVEQTSASSRPPMTIDGEGPAGKITPHGRRGNHTQVGGRHQCGKVCCHEGSTQNVCVIRRWCGIEKIKARGKNVVRKPIHVNDGCRDPLICAISCKVRAWVVENLVPLVGEKGRGSRK
jgi:hypothetical protein